MNNKNLYLDIHAIQTVPPSNINRDDTGSPKTAQYGGVTRARVSSQSWKKAIRNYFIDNCTDESMVGVRSLKIVEYIAKEIREIDSNFSEDEALKLANKVLNDAGISTKEGIKVKALFFISPKQVHAVAELAVNNVSNKNELQKVLNGNPSIDIALFGRMVADDPSLNEDASCQVAHSISTHGIETEFDFFTATDDLSSDDTAGAGMLGTIEFNSSTLYRYANVAAHELKQQLIDVDATIDALKLFVEAFIKSMPTGKVNTFANQTLPQAVVVCIRKDRPVSLVAAFESPVKSAEGYVEKSKNKLKEEFNNVLKYVDEPVYTFTLGLNGIGEEQPNIKALIDNFAEGVRSLLQ